MAKGKFIADAYKDFDNLKYEPTEKGKSAARMGKATSAFVDDLVEVYLPGRWDRTWQQYPRSYEAFAGTDPNKESLKVKEYKKKIQVLVVLQVLL